MLKLQLVGILTVAMSVPCVFAQEGSTVAKNVSPATAEQQGNEQQGAGTKHADGTVDQYCVGESDTLRVVVWKEPDLSGSVVVRPDGQISMPLIRNVQVAGLTTTQIEQQIADKLKEFVKNPQVTVTVQEVRSQKAYVTGEVAKPGAYPLLAPTTILQVIAQAGGFTAFAKRNKIVVLREENGHQTRYRFDYQKVIHGEKIEQNITLRSGDTVVVP